MSKIESLKINCQFKIKRKYFLFEICEKVAAITSKLGVHFLFTRNEWVNITLVKNSRFYVKDNNYSRLILYKKFIKKSSSKEFFVSEI